MFASSRSGCGGHTVAWGRSARREKIFSDGKRFLGRQGERWRAAEATPLRWHAFPGLPLPAPGFLRPPASRGGLRKPGSVLLSEKDFLPISGWAAKWCGDVEG